MPAWLSYPLALLLSLALTALIAWHAARLGLVDQPNLRSSHFAPTPRGGGAAIVIATLIAWTASRFLQPPEHDPLSSQPIEAALLLGLPIAVIGLLDDRHGVAARWRFLTQGLVVACLLLWLAPLPGFLLAPGYALPPAALWLGLWFFGVAWINAFNFMDGIDGLAASEALFMLAAGALLAATGMPEAINHPLFTLLLTIAAATLGFLLLNWSPARIFMGDVGSTWLAFMIFALAILTVRAGWMNFGSWLILGAVFVADTTLTLLVRIRNGERWYSAHRSHAYQHAVGRLLRKGQSRTQAHRRATLAAAAINIAWLLPLACAAQAWPHYNMVICTLAYIPLIVIALRLGAGRSDPIA
jgi:Fuc2NAc and GlcNAc transferase